METAISQLTQPSPYLGIERSWRGTIRLVSSFLPLILLLMLLGASSFQLVVDKPNWTGVPALEHYRAFYQVTNPGTFFQTLLPAALLALLAALVCNWRPIPATRWRLAGALALTILAGVITFTFHFPRNKILFEDPLTRPAAYYRQVVAEWAAGDYVRIAVIATAIVLVAVSMIRIARDTVPKKLLDSNTSGAR
jgi:ABC-type transport system involved in cytochrome c biogenesis permease subunit